MIMRVLKLSALLAACLVSVSHAANVRTVDWDDLVPKFESELIDPLAALGLDRRMELESIIWARTLSEQEREQDDFKTGAEDAELFVREFRERGQDIDKLVADYKAWRLAVDERNKQVVKELDGKQVRLAGYLLPLEFSEDGVKEFLLVPYVGACIHTPAPPANQVVFVELRQSYKVDGLYSPVWVIGKMSTRTSSKALNFVDGSANIPSGYSLAASDVEPYTE